MSLERSTSLNIACAIDDSFVYPLSVMLVSVLENHKNENVRIHLFSASLSEEYVPIFERLVSKYNQSFLFYRLDKKIFTGLPINDRISYAAYYRLQMPENIDPEVKTFLYLDADTIVIGDLKPLFRLDMGDKIFAAVNDICAIDWNMHKKHHIPDQYLYFNSGVLLIDRKKWIARKATQIVLTYLNNNYEICNYHDQDGLNGALYDQRFTLPPIWNSQIGLHFIEPTLLENVYTNEYKQAIKKPVIVHFNGIEKPWHHVSTHPCKKQFNRYATKVEEFKYDDRLTLKKALKHILLYGILGWKNVNKYFYYKTRPVYNG